MTRRRALAVAALALLLPACATSPPDGAAPGEGEAEPRPVTTLVVENRGYLDMNIYAVTNGQRQRLGFATGNRTTRLTIPARLIFGTSPMRFLADPVGSNRTPISHEVQVRAGDVVTITILP